MYLEESHHEETQEEDAQERGLEQIFPSQPSEGISHANTLISDF